MVSRKGKTPRPISSYRGSAKELAKLIPSLSKYKNRKRLSPQEKAAITRAERKAREVRGAIPLTAAQAKRLGKKALIGGGVRGIAMEGFGRDSKLYVPKNKTGRVQIRSANRRIHLVAFQADDIRAYDEDADAIDQWADEIGALFQDNKGKHVTVWLWTANGRSHEGFRSLGAFLDKIEDILSGRKYQNAEKWLLGYQYLVEKPRS